MTDWIPAAMLNLVTPRAPKPIAGNMIVGAATANPTPATVPTVAPIATLDFQDIPDDDESLPEGPDPSLLGGSGPFGGPDPLLGKLLYGIDPSDISGG